MPRGRTPKPTALKVLAGNPGKRPLNRREPKPQGTVGEPPEHLSDGAKAAWRLAVDCAPPGLLTPLDSSILLIWATAADLYHKAQEGLAKTGMLIKGPNNGMPIQSPYLAIANKQAQIMAKAATEMGFTPASRSRVTLPMETADNLDPWSDIAG
jgi:P27 family predicted phage terminase small subunit